MSHDPFEDRVRDSMRARPDVDVDPEEFLGSVHRSARRRRTRSVVVAVVASVIVVFAGGFGLDSTGWRHGNTGPVAGSNQTRTSGPTTSTRTTAPPINIGFAPLSLTATGADNQWVLGTTGCGAPHCLFIKHIHRGQLVDDVTAPPSRVGVAGAGPDTVTQIRFVGAGGADGWAFGGALWTTHDAGHTWQRVRLPVPGQVTALEPWGGRVYAAVQQGGRAQLVTSPVHTDDWQPEALPVRFRRIDSIATGAHVTAVAGADGTGRAVVLTNTDRTPWARTSGCTGAASAKVSTAPRALWLLCRTGQRATAFVSTDDGRTFRAAHGAFAWNTEIAARTPTSAIVAGDGGVIEASTTAYPRAILDVPGFAHGRAGVTFAGFTNASDGYLITLAGGLIRTTDGGSTWELVRLRR
jgi:photosystem II stability/assembly factor-like uncharacterized protein